MAELLEDQGEDQEEEEDRNYVFLDDDKDDDSLVLNEDPFFVSWQQSNTNIGRDGTTKN
jgi:hypothetical protein